MNSNFETETFDYWDVDNDCSSLEVYPVEDGGEAFRAQHVQSPNRMKIRSLCTTGDGQNFIYEVTDDRLPLKINQNYLNEVQPVALFKTWFRFRNAGGGVTPTMNHEVRLAYGSVLPLNLDETLAVPESAEYTEHVHIVEDLHTRFSVSQRHFAIGLGAVDEDSLIDLAPMELLIDLPINIGCFRKNVSTMSASSQNTPAKCITHCLSSLNHRFAALADGRICYCFDEFPVDEVTAMADEDCERVCDGDSEQFCGGQTSEHLVFYVATCPDPTYQKRFGDFCFKKVDNDRDIRHNADLCRGDVSNPLFTIKL